jgi:hypothetical protein
MSLDENQIRALLVVAMAYDNRRPGDAAVEAWMDAAGRARWAFVDAREAIKAHYAESHVFITPGHITERLKVGKRQPPPVAELEGPTDPPADPERIRELVESLADDLAWPESQGSRSPGLSVRCPVVHCHAVPFRPCTRSSSRGAVERSTPHPSRIELAETADLNEEPSDA